MGASKKRCVRVYLQVHGFMTPKIAITLTKTLNKHKLSLLINADTAECNVSQHKKTVTKLSTMALQALKELFRIALQA